MKILSLKKRRRTTRSFFDVDYYLDNNPDVRASGVDPFEHYLVHGWREGRDPSDTFNNDWYRETHLDESDDSCPLIHYATVGVIDSLATEPPAVTDQHPATFEHQGRAYTITSPDEVSSLIRELVAGSRDLQGVGMLVQWLPDCAHILEQEIVVTASASSDRESNDPLLTLIAQLAAGKTFEELFQFLFSGAHYRESLAEIGETLPDREDAFLHWMSVGRFQGVDPVPWFSQPEYLKAHPDLEAYTDGLYFHFARHGIKEGRNFSRLYPIARHQADEDSPNLVQRFLQRMASDPATVEEVQQTIDFWQSEEMLQIVESARQLEPSIGSVADISGHLRAPWHDQYFWFFESYASALDDDYEFCILVPHMKMGGSDKLSGVIANELVELGKTLVIVTDASFDNVHHWYPDGATYIDLSEITSSLDKVQQNRLLYELLRYVGTKHTFFVNSRNGFEMFTVYGERLIEFTRPYFYFFCNDLTNDGCLTGYPVEYFTEVLPNCAAAIFDSKALALEMCGLYPPSEELMERIVTLYSPYTGESAVPTEPSTGSDIRNDSPRVVWAGRLDRQKRFDLVVQIAERMPDVSFDCWGAAVLDAPPDLQNLPENITMKGLFTSLAEIGFDSQTVFLYTSLWDGIPTILLDVGAKAVPIVASGVGGVPEVVDESTGWLMSPGAEAADYVTALREALENRERSAERARALRSKILKQHSPDEFRARLVESMRLRTE